MKICFYVSRNATRLKRFINYAKGNSPELLCLIGTVVTDNVDDIELSKLCADVGIETVYLNNKSFEKKNIESSNFVYDVMVSGGFDYLFIYCDTILKGRLVKTYRNRIINFHPSLLPAHRGLFAIDQAINEKTFLLGNSAHFVDEGIDTGPVIMQSIVHRLNYKTYDDVLDMQVKMIAQIIIWLKDSRITQNDGIVVVVGASYNVGEYIPNLEINILEEC